MEAVPHPRPAKSAHINRSAIVIDDNSEEEAEPAGSRIGDVFSVSDDEMGAGSVLGKRHDPVTSDQQPSKKHIQPVGLSASLFPPRRTKVTPTAAASAAPAAAVTATTEAASAATSATDRSVEGRSVGVAAAAAAAAALSSAVVDSGSDTEDMEFDQHKLELEPSATAQRQREQDQDVSEEDENDVDEPTAAAAAAAATTASTGMTLKKRAAILAYERSRLPARHGLTTFVVPLCVWFVRHSDGLTSSSLPQSAPYAEYQPLQAATWKPGQRY